jgi:hypothetical protein
MTASISSSRCVVPLNFQRPPQRGEQTAIVRESECFDTTVCIGIARLAQPLSTCRVVGNAADDGRRGVEARGAAE